MSQGLLFKDMVTHKIAAEQIIFQETLFKHYS